VLRRHVPVGIGGCGSISQAVDRPGHRGPVSAAEERPNISRATHGTGLMKLIKAIIRPNKVDETKTALERLGVSGVTVTDVRGHGQQKGRTAFYRGQEYRVSLVPKVEIEVVAGDEMVEEIVQAIVQSARTGDVGDGRVFVIPIAESYRIRTR